MYCTLYTCWLILQEFGVIAIYNTNSTKRNQLWKSYTSPIWPCRITCLNRRHEWDRIKILWARSKERRRNKKKWRNYAQSSLDVKPLDSCIQTARSKEKHHTYYAHDLNREATGGIRSQMKSASNSYIRVRFSKNSCAVPSLRKLKNA